MQFFRPLKVLQKTFLITRLFYIDDKWIYLEQKITREGKEIAVCIVKSTVKRGKEVVDLKEILRELGLESFPSEGKEIVEAHEKENRLVSLRLSSYVLI